MKNRRGVQLPGVNQDDARVPKAWGFWKLERNLLIKIIWVIYLRSKYEPFISETCFKRSCFMGCFLIPIGTDQQKEPYEAMQSKYGITVCKACLSRSMSGKCSHLLLYQSKNSHLLQKHKEMTTFCEYFSLKLSYDLTGNKPTLKSSSNNSIVFPLSPTIPYV